MNYKVLALDLDGTLLNSEKEISKKTLDALIDAQERGYRVVIATGRPTGGVVRYADELQLDKYGNYVLSFNGALITNWQTKENIFNQAFPIKLIPELYEIAKENNVGLVTYKGGNQVISAFEPNEYLLLEARLNNIDIKHVEDFISYVDFPSNKCLMGGDPEVLIRLEEELKKKYHGLLLITRSEPYFLEFMPMNVDKAHSLSNLMTSLGYGIDELICCGDGFNDISMISAAGLGVAMENAREAVRSEADYITASNDDNGIVQVIEKFMK